MKFKIFAAKLLPVVLGISISSCLHAQIHKDIASPYQTQLVKAELQHELATLRLFKLYQESLDQVYGRAQQAGNLDLLTTVRREQERVKESRTLPNELSSVEAIANLQVILKRELRTIDVEKAKKVLDSTRAYYKSLETYERQLVTSDQIEKAIEVRKIRTELPTSDLVREARDLVDGSRVIRGAPKPLLANIPEDAVTFQNRHYLLIKEKKTFTEAKADCQERGGRLVQIENEEINEFISTYIRDDRAAWIWIGLSDAESEGKWLWSNGRPVDYANWRNNEPNNRGGNEHFVAMHHSGTWNDYPDAKKNFYVCEWGP